MLLQVGGHIEVTETPWEAIRHEIIEETGYDLDQLKILQPLVRITSLEGAVLHPQPVAHNTHNFDPDGQHKHTDISYAFIADSAPNNQPASGESTTFRWVDLSSLKSIEKGQIYENVRKIGEYVLTTVLNTWEVVDLSEFQ